MRRMVLVAALTPLLVAAPAHAARVGVSWPAERAYAPGEPLLVKVASKRPVRVALVRESARGKVMRTIARKTLRTGTFRAAAPSAGRYSLRVGARKQVVSVVAPTAPNPAVPTAPSPAAPTASAPASTYPADRCATPSGPPAAELRLGATSVRPGETLPYVLANTGGTCLAFGVGYTLERQLVDGSWALVELPWVFTTPGIVLLPGHPEGGYPKHARIPTDALPGSYRLLDNLDGGGQTINLSATFTVTA